MQSIQLDASRPLDMVLLGRVAIDLNPVDYFKTLAESTTFRKYVGGSPANIAVGLARLGRKAGFVAKVSNDRFGDFVTGYFRNEGIDVAGISRCQNGESLGLTFTEILSPTESSILMYRNGVADLALAPEDVSPEYLSKAKCLLISGTALAASPSREAAFKAAQLAECTGTPAIFDIDYRAYSWKSPEETAVYYAQMARYATILLGSREEYDLTMRFCAPGLDDEAVARYWMDGAAKLVVIKHGKEGSVAFSNEGSYKVRPFPVKALKGFGGGDGYASALLYGILEGLPLKDALELGSASASMLVASHACSQDMPNIGSLTEFVKAGKAEHGEMVTCL